MPDHMPQFYQTYLLYLNEFLKMKLTLCKASKSCQFSIQVLTILSGFYQDLDFVLV